MSTHGVEFSLEQTREMAKFIMELCASGAAYEVVSWYGQSWIIYVNGI